MNTTTIQILTTTSVCLSLIVLIFCVIPAIRIAVSNANARKTWFTSGPFHKTLKRLSSYNNKISIEIDGVIMGNTKIPNDLLDLAVDEMAFTLAQEDAKWGRCLIQKSSVLDVYGIPSPGVSWILESTESPVIWRGQTDQNGSVVEVYELKETETQMRFATTKNNEAFQVPTNYVYHQALQ